jgi:hypothetical protein
MRQGGDASGRQPRLHWCGDGAHRAANQRHLDVDFDDFLDAYGIPYTFRASPLPEYMLHLPGGDTKILCRSFENWSRIIGLNLAWVLADEIDTVTPAIANKAFPKILGRLRAGNVRQFGAASHRRASAGCGTPLAVKRRKAATIAS